MDDFCVHHLSPATQQGVIAVERGEFDQACKIFNHLNAQEPGNAIVLSYVGMLQSLQGGRIYEGLDLCLLAHQKDPEEALVYLNLSRCYLAAGDRYQAIRAIHRGLKLKSPHAGILVNFYKAMGMRRKPVLRFLHRDNPLNVALGRITWRMKGPGFGAMHPTVRNVRKRPGTP